MNREAKLLNGEGTAFEQALLSSVKGESPSKALSLQMMGPISGIPGPVVEPSPGLAAGGAAKWAIATVAVLGVGAGAMFFTAPFNASQGSASSAQNSATPALDQKAPQDPQAGIAGVESSARSGSQDASSAQVGDLSESERNVATDPASPASTSAKSSPDQGSPHTAKEINNRLAEEMRLLDKARAALASHAPEKALSLLAIYDSRYAQGTLRQEATVLRVSALKATGKKSQAAQLTNEFLKASPNSAHKTRLQEASDAQENTP